MLANKIWCRLMYAESASVLTAQRCRFDVYPRPFPRNTHTHAGTPMFAALDIVAAAPMPAGHNPSHIPHSYQQQQHPQQQQLHQHQHQQQQQQQHSRPYADAGPPAGMYGQHGGGNYGGYGQAYGGLVHGHGYGYGYGQTPPYGQHQQHYPHPHSPYSAAGAAPYYGGYGGYANGLAAAAAAPPPTTTTWGAAHGAGPAVVGPGGVPPGAPAPHLLPPPPPLLQLSVWPATDRLIPTQVRALRS